jgi:hypothetical protein
MERRPYLFGSASAAGILFWASPKGALDLIASRPRSTPLSLRPPGPAWRTPRCPGNSPNRALRFSVAPLRSARSLRSLAPFPVKCQSLARNLPVNRCGGGSPPPPRPLGRVARCAPRRAIACGVERHPPARRYPLKRDVEGVPLKPHPLNTPPPYRAAFGFCSFFRIVFMCSSARRTET